MPFMSYFDVKRIFIAGWMSEGKKKKKRRSEGDKTREIYSNEWTAKVGEKWNKYIFIKCVAEI